MQTRMLLLCHPTAREGEAMALMLRSAMRDVSVIVAEDLTEVYDTVEHRRPDYLVTARELALHPDFAGIQALVQHLGVESLIWNSQSQRLVRARDSAAVPASQGCSIGQFVETIDKNRSTIPAPVTNSPSNGSRNQENAIILIGASTGGVDAICQVIQHFGPTSPPTLIVQHTSGQFAQSLTRLLDGMTSADVILAKHDQKLQFGTIYLAPGDGHHLLLGHGARPRIALGAQGLICGHRPSVDALFRSAVPQAPQVVAALLTGMGRDGAEGLKALHEAGAHTIAQDQATSVVYGMPRIAAEIGAVTHQLSLPKIGPALLAASSARTTA